MKKQIFFLTVLCIYAYTNAIVWTVSNNPVDSAAAQYSELQEAIDAAAASDTIYVSGSPNTYGSITITKQLILIGAGYNPDNQFDLKSQVETITLEIGMDGFGNPVSTPSYSKFDGFFNKRIESRRSICLPQTPEGSKLFSALVPFKFKRLHKIL